MFEKRGVLPTFYRSEALLFALFLMTMVWVDRSVDPFTGKWVACLVVLLIVPLGYVAHKRTWLRERDLARESIEVDRNGVTNHTSSPSWACLPYCSGSDSKTALVKRRQKHRRVAFNEVKSVRLSRHSSRRTPRHYYSVTLETDGGYTHIALNDHVLRKRKLVPVDIQGRKTCSAEYGNYPGHELVTLLYERLCRVPWMVTSTHRTPYGVKEIRHVFSDIDHPWRGDEIVLLGAWPSELKRKYIGAVVAVAVIAGLATTIFMYVYYWIGF